MVEDKENMNEKQKDEEKKKTKRHISCVIIRGEISPME